MAFHRPRRDERGATAVMVALLALVLFGAGAFATDMGQVYAKRAALQSNVDLAVLAAAPKIDGSGTCTAEALAAASDYLTKPGNEVDGQVPMNLSDGNPANGEMDCHDWRVDLTAPPATVDFGLAKALSPSNTGVDVPAKATAAVLSPTTSSSLPMYAVSGCDSGTQVISNPPPGPPADPTVPDLVPDSAPTFNTADFAISPTEVASATPAPAPMTLTGTNLGGATAVGFTSAGGDHYEVTGASLTVTATSITVTSVPADVLAKDGVWWVRVLKGTAWSPEQQAQPFMVGEILFCDGAISGNFGTLRIARSEPNWWVEHNIMFGIEPMLETYPDLGAAECDDGVAPAVTSEHAPTDGTNCLGTDPGFPNAAGTAGLVTGKGGDPGRLNADTTPGCSRSGGDSRTGSTPTTPSAVTLNDDVLTCFFVDDSTRIQDAVDGVPNILSADIFKSPRFFQLPVLPTEAEHGSSGFYPIIGFRPGFITDQPLYASRSAPAASSISTYNGVEFQSGHVEKLTVVLFDEAALPETAPPVGGEIPYTGSGTKVIALVE